MRKINISIDSIQSQSSTLNEQQQQQQTTTKLTPENTDSSSIPTSFWPPLPPTDPLACSIKPAYIQTWSSVKLTDKEKKQNANKILEELLTTPILQIKPVNVVSSSLQTEYNYLCDLLSHKSADGLTPFMYAVSLRAYDAGLMILETALKMRMNLTQTLLKLGNLNNLNYKRDLLFTNMIFPLGSRTDQSPLFVLCSNDTCSFTWTGDNHITQDIFECRTCTLVGNLCCCTECARTCHKGHDCKIKTSSPTAYCDCWEKCKCKSLIAGDQEKRFKLLDKLLAETTLLNASNSRGESILTYLVQTVGRQIQEQRNYKRHCGNSNLSASSRRTIASSGYAANTSSDNNANSSGGITGNIGDMPQHDLEPPKFCKRALERIFNDWYSIKQIFLFNNSRYQSDSDAESTSSDDDDDDDDKEDLYNSRLNKKKKSNKLREQMGLSSFAKNSLLFDESAYMDAQSGCVDLDKFVYLLIMKCPSDILTILVDTIQSNLNDTQNKENEDKNESIMVVKRLVRSVTRLFVILCIETSPSNLQINLNLNSNQSSSKISTNQSNRTDSSNLTSKMSINSRLARFKSLNTTNNPTPSVTNTSTPPPPHPPSTTTTTTIASLVTVSPIAKCEYILKQFSKYSIEELANAAHSLIAPVVLGITKPSTYKLSILSSNLTGSNNTVSFNSNNNNSGEFSSSGVNGNNANSLADELFNLEPPIQRLFTTAISTNLILPTPESVKSMLSTNPQQQQLSTVKTETPQFINTFESVHFSNNNNNQANDSLIQNDETLSENSNAAKNDLIQEKDDTQNSSSMPPPLMSNQDSSSSQQLNIESDNNSNSSTASNKSNRSVNRARSVASSSKCSSSTAKQRHGALSHFSNRDSSNSSKSSGSSTSSASSSNNSNDSNHSNSNSSSSSSSSSASNSSSNSSDSSSDTNSNDTAITESSASTSNTKRSTMALKNGRSGESGSTNIPNLVNRRVTSVNFVDPFSLILLNSRNSNSSIDANIGDDTTSLTTQSTLSRHRSRHSQHKNNRSSNQEDFNNNNNNNNSKLETSSVVSSSSLATTGNDFSQTGNRSIASYFTDEDDDDDDEEDEDNDEIDNDDNNSNDLSTNDDDDDDNNNKNNNDDEFDDNNEEQSSEIMDENSSDRKNKRKRKRILLNKNVASTDKNAKKSEISSQVSGKKSLETSLNQTNREDEEEIENEQDDDIDDDVDEDENEDVDDEEDEDLDDFDIEQYNDDENMDTSQDNNDLNGITNNIQLNSENSKKKNNKQVSNKTSYNIIPITIKSNLRSSYETPPPPPPLPIATTTTKSTDEKSKSLPTNSTLLNPIDSSKRPVNTQLKSSSSTVSLNTTNSTSNSNINTQTAPNPTTLYSPSSSNFQRTTTQTNNLPITRSILPTNSSVSAETASSNSQQRRSNSSASITGSSTINTIIQQYNNNNSNNSIISQGYDQQRINIINSINQSSSSSLGSSATPIQSSSTTSSTGSSIPLTAQPPTYHHTQSGANNNHHMTLGDYYYAAHNLANTTNSISNPGSNSFSNILNNSNIILDSHRNHGHHSHQHHTTANLTANTIPTSNSAISGSVPQTELISSFNTPSSASLTNNTLARVFSILVKLIRDLLNNVYLERIEHQKFLNNKKESKNHKKAVSKYLQKITKKINKKLESPWQWLVSLMDSTESQLRFGASLSASQMSELSTNATQYLRHLEEKALLTNYFNNHGNSSQNNYGYYSSNNLVGGGPFISSRFGSGIDARRKLNIMQHQHQQFANMHLNQSYQHYNPNSIQIASNNYYQPQNLQASSSGSSQGSTNQVGTSFGISSISRSSNASGNILNSNADQIIQANTTNTSSNSNNNNSQSISTLASQFAASQIISSRRDFMSYALSLMRAQTNEHRDSLPSIDISLLKHVAYIFDGILFYLQSNLSNSMASIKIETEESSDDEEESLDENTTNDTEGIEEDDSDDSESENKKFKKKINIKDYYYFEKDDESEEEEEEEENLKQFDDKILGSYYYDDDDGGDDDDDDDDDEDDDDNKSIESNDKDKESKSDEKSKNKSDEESIEFSHDKSKKRKFNFINNSDEKKKTENKPFLIKNPCSRTSSFFKRSNSTLCLGAESPDPFAYSLEESLPLASKPHLLQPHSRIQDMFKIKSNNVAQFISLKNIGLMSYNLRSNAPELKDPFLYKKSHRRNHSTIKKNQDSKHSGKQAAAAESKKVKKQSSKYLDKFEKKLFKLASINDQYIKDPSISQISKPNNLIDRWRLTVDLFGRVFCDDVGLEPASIIRQFGGFQLKEAKFRREMERLRNIATRELLMEVERERDLLLLTTFKSLNNMYNLQYSRRAAAAANMSGNSGSSSSTSSTLLPPPLCLNRIKVTFKDEQGEGSGVARSFYTAFSEAILADLKLPSLESCSYTSSTSSSSLSSNQSNSSVSYVPFSMLQRYRNSRSSNQVDLMVNTHRRPNSSATYSSIPIPTNSVLTRSSIRARDQLLLINSAVSYATSSSLVANSTSESADESIHQNTASNSVYSNTTPSSNNNGQQLSVNAPPFFSPLIAITSSALNDLPSFDLSFYNSLDVQHREYGQQLFTKISSLLSQNQQTPNVNTFKAAKITGMLLELRSNQIQQLLSSDSLLKSRFDESCNLLASTTDSTTSSNSSSSGSSIFSNLQNSFNKSEQTLIRDDSPLFWQPDKSMACAGFYAPRAGLNTTARLNAFRNVGRIMAICLLQNELCPITLSRHAIKYILNKPIKWHDLAFFDSQMYESFRKMINDAEKVLVSAIVDAKESCKIKSKSKIRVALIRAIADVNEQLFKPLDLTFNIDLPREEDGTNNDLIENGSKIEVNVFNMYEYVKRYAEFRMVSHVELCLQELKSGVFDVLPANALDGLTAEDFRLLLNGVADINIHTLASYTTISDESKESSRRPHFEKWFWATLEKMNQQEKQELLFFWTGSPYLPASEEGFQPLPTITLRPPSDQHLPTANTCINRLYLPMYSSKSILKSKILQAIKTKTFGFV